MGVLNTTPDSFSDGGRFLAPAAALAQGLRMLDEGAHIVDVGGESTRPGAEPVPEEEELRRVLPVVEALARRDVPISVDTMKPGVMARALAAGACLINDVNALAAPGALEVVGASDCAVVLMHCKGTPQTMQADPVYADVVAEVRQFLRQRLDLVLAAGVGKDRVLLDPGFGFGKTTEHNLRLLRGFSSLSSLDRPLLAGLSRKSLLGKITGLAVSDRVVASATAAVLAVQHGASVVRVHDVAATRDALAVLAAVGSNQ